LQVKEENFMLARKKRRKFCSTCKKRNLVKT